VVRPARHIDLRIVLGLFLVLLTLGGGLVFWQTLDQTTPVLVYARDFPAGAAIQPDDLTTVSFAVPPELQGVVVTASDRRDVIGKVAAEAVHQGGLVQLVHLSGRPAVPSGGGIVALPVSATSAAGGQLRIGDHVRVIATWNRGRDDAKTETILPDAVVEDVGRSATTSLGDSSASSAGAAINWVSVVVTSSTDMEALVAAKENAALDLIWLAPSTGVTVQPSPRTIVPASTPPIASPAPQSTVTVGPGTTAPQTER
jgi:Flp pilus assembly protein CpaB